MALNFNLRGSGMRSIFKVVFTVFILGNLTSCETVMPPQKFADLSYKHQPVIRFAVDRIDVAHKFIMPNLKKNIGAETPVKPSTVANQWAKDRLRAVGGENIILVTIAQASIVEVPLLVKDGIQGIFTNDQSERYDGTIEIKIEVKNKKGKQLGMISSKSNRSQTVPEDTTITERKKVWFELVETMMKDLDSSLEKQVHQNFQKWLY